MALDATQKWLSTLDWLENTAREGLVEVYSLAIKHVVDYLDMTKPEDRTTLSNIYDMQSINKAKIIHINHAGHDPNRPSMVVIIWCRYFKKPEKMVESK